MTRKKMVTRKRVGGKKTESKKATSNPPTKPKSIVGRRKAMAEFSKVLLVMDEVSDCDDAWDKASEIRELLAEGDYRGASDELMTMAEEMPEYTHDWDWIEDFQPVAEARRVSMTGFADTATEYKRQLWEEIGKSYDKGDGWRQVFRGHGGSKTGWVWRFRPSVREYTFSLEIAPARDRERKEILGKWDSRLYRGPGQYRHLQTHDSDEDAIKWARRWLWRGGLDPRAAWDKTPNLKPWERDPNYRGRR